MSNKDISRYLVKEDGTAFATDNDLQALAVNSKVTNVNSGLTYKKTASNVYDKTPIEVETDAVLYSPQTLTNEQKTQARTNIGAVNTSDLSGFVRADVIQVFDQMDLIKAAFNTGLRNYDIGWVFRSLTFGIYQLAWGSTNNARTGMHGNGRLSEAVFSTPFAGYYAFVCTPRVSSPENSKRAGVLGTDVNSPRVCGVGMEDGGSVANYIAVGPRMVYNYIGTVSGNVDLNDTSSFTFSLDKNLVDNSLSSISLIVDMFISRDSANTNYIEYTGSPSFGSKKISTKEVDDTPYDREYDLDLGREITDSYDDVVFMGYEDFSNGQLYKNTTLKRFVMRSFCINVSSSSFFNGASTYDMTFNHQLTGAVGRIRIMYPAKYPNRSSGNSNNSSSSSENESSGSSESSSTQTWGVTMFETASSPYGAARKTIGQSVSEGTVVREYHITQWTSTGPSTYVPGETKCYYVWKANGYTLTSSDRVLINSLATQSYMTGVSYPRITYDSGTI